MPLHQLLIIVQDNKKILGLSSAYSAGNGGSRRSHAVFSPDLFFFTFSQSEAFDPSNAAFEEKPTMSSAALRFGTVIWLKLIIDSFLITQITCKWSIAWILIDRLCVNSPGEDGGGGGGSGWGRVGKKLARRLTYRLCFALPRKRSVSVASTGIRYVLQLRMKRS